VTIFKDYLKNFPSLQKESKRKDVYIPPVVLLKFINGSVFTFEEMGKKILKTTHLLKFEKANHHHRFIYISLYLTTKSIQLRM
jgi:hypothetical protein